MSGQLTRRSVSAGLLFSVMPRSLRQPRVVMLKQASSGRFLITERNSPDRNVVASATHESAVWFMTDQGYNVYTFHRLAPDEMGHRAAYYLDAHEAAEQDYRVVCRPRQTFDTSQLWRLIVVKGHREALYEIVQVSSGRLLDALDIHAVTRPRQRDARQFWALPARAPG